MNEKEKLLEEVSLPVVEYLKKNHDPYTTIVITQDEIKLMQTEMGMPV